MEESPLISVLIVEDHRPVRVALQAVIRCEADLVVAGVTGNPQAAAEGVRSGSVDVVVIDLELEGGSGLELLPAIQNGSDGPEAVVYSIYNGPGVVGPALRAGARGYVCKDQLAATVMEAIRAVAAGKIYLRRELREQLIHELTSSSDANDQTPKCLSDRELSVFQMIGAGATTGTIAERLHLAGSTVDTYRRRIRQKLGCRPDYELPRRATGGRSGQ